MFEAMEKVRECINGGAYDAAFAIAETEEEKRQRQTGVFSPLSHFFIIEIITQKTCMSVNIDFVIFA